MSRPRRTDGISQRLRVAVGQRLLLGLAPSLFALVLVIALAYYGEIGRQAPEYVVGGAGVLAVLSLAVTWWNARYLVGRLRRLGRNDAGGTEESRAVDELDRIEGEVSRLTDALTVSMRERAAEQAKLMGQVHDQATMMAATVRGVTAQVDEVRLPLHILLDARFGELNENQVELLAAARNAADAIDAALRRLSIVADTDRDASDTPIEPVALNDVVRAVLPMVRATADRRDVRVDVSLEPALPRVWANRATLAESIATIATLAVERMATGVALSISTMPSERTCAITISPVEASLLDESLIIAAQRLLQVQSAELKVVQQVLQITLSRALAVPERQGNT